MIKENNRNSNNIESYFKVKRITFECEEDKKDFFDELIVSSFICTATLFWRTQKFILETNYYNKNIHTKSKRILFDGTKFVSNKKNEVKDLYKKIIDINVSDETIKQCIIFRLVKDEEVIDVNSDYKDFAFNLKIHSNCCEIETIYDSKYFSDMYIDSFLQSFKHILVQLCDDSLTMLSFVTPKIEQEMNHLNNSINGIGYNNIQERFAEVVSCFSSKIAVEDLGVSLSYQELDEKSNAIANIIQTYIGRSSQKNVCILLNRSIEQVVVFLSVIKSGHCYIPFEPINKEMRLEYILKNADIPIIITKSEFMDTIPDVYLENVLRIDKVYDLLSKTPPKDLHTTKKSCAYANYTSGSTGQPKGVTITHEGILRLALNQKGFKIDSNDVILHSSSTSFDATTFEVWSTLLNGGRIVVISREKLLSIDGIKDVIKRCGITGMFITSSLFNKIVDIDADVFKNLHFVLTGGDVAIKDRFQTFKKRNPEISLVHVYGPTENTTFSTYYVVDEIDYENSDISIGKPIDNSSVYIVDPENNRVPQYVVGQILVGGCGIAKGYINNLQLTDKVFSSDIITNDRIYKTGDYGYFDNKYNIHFCGRKDRQVKVRGFRIELDEIEKILLENKAVKDCTVVVCELESCKKIVLYYVSNLSDKEVRAYLQDKLADYMLPQYIIKLDEIPINFNGKIFFSNLKKKFKMMQREKIKSMGNLVYKIWSEVLENDDIDIHKNFFELGADSLSLVTVCSRLRKEVSSQIDITILLRYQSIEKLSNYLETNIKNGLYIY